MLSGLLISQQVSLLADYYGVLRHLASSFSFLHYHGHSISTKPIKLPFWQNELKSPYLGGTYCRQKFQRSFSVREKAGGYHRS
jgi:hypothetical protein